MAYRTSPPDLMANVVEKSRVGACPVGLCARPSLIFDKARIQRNRLYICAHRVPARVCANAYLLLPELCPMLSGGAYIPVVSLCADGPMKSYDSDFGENWKMQTMIDPDKPKKILAKRTMIC